MNVLLGAAGAACAALAGAELLVLLAQRASVTAVAAVLGPAYRVAGRGRTPDREGRLVLTALAGTAAFASLALAGSPLLGAVLALAAPAASTLVIGLRRARWKSAMRSGAAAAARAIGDAAAAGLPGIAAIERASADGAVPTVVATELRDLATRCRLGLDLEVGLEELRRRALSTQWDAVVAAVLVQREVGGDLALILGSLASGLDASVRARAEAKSLSSQARLTARIVVAMPVAGLVISELASPGTLSKMVSSPLPRLLVGVAVVLQGVAVVIVRRVAGLGGAGR